MTGKKLFLVDYDYGTGGVWGVMLARSADEITERYPFLTVSTVRPFWMTDDEYARISKHIYDVDDPPAGWLTTLPRDEDSAGGR